MDELRRFVEAQGRSYETALAEIRSGKKKSHWMWYIFPQVKGLGFSDTSRHYGIKDISEASKFLEHPVLGKRLINICNELLKLKENNAHKIFGSPDDLKLKSSMTLFSLVPGAESVFNDVLIKFFSGEKDARTMDILKK